MKNCLSKPFITIILPTKNSDGTLEAALQSIYEQTFRNFEILIIDNLSSDRTLEIAATCQNELGKMRIISEKDVGIYDAMNKGITLSQGEWIYFMGSDDILFEKNTLEKVENEIDEDVEVIYGNVFSSRFNGVYDREFSYFKLAHQNICHQAILFRKRVFEKIGNFNLKYKIHSDWDHNIRWFFSSEITCKYINQIIAVYADGGFSSVNFDETFAQDKEILILKRGIGKMSYKELNLLLKSAMYQEKRLGFFKELLLFYPLYLIFGIIGKIKKTILNHFLFHSN